MTNIWGLWFFFYIPAFIAGCLAGGSFILALSCKIIKNERQRAALHERVQMGKVVTLSKYKKASNSIKNRVNISASCSQ